MTKKVNRELYRITETAIVEALTPIRLRKQRGKARLTDLLKFEEDVCYGLNVFCPKFKCYQYDSIMKQPLRGD
jgi:hypothetical protein